MNISKMIESEETLLLWFTLKDDRIRYPFFLNFRHNYLEALDNLTALRLVSGRIDSVLCLGKPVDRRITNK
jgi:hypothetical protein